MATTQNTIDPRIEQLKKDVGNFGRHLFSDYEHLDVHKLNFNTRVVNKNENVNLEVYVALDKQPFVGNASSLKDLQKSQIKFEQLLKSYYDKAFGGILSEVKLHDYTTLRLSFNGERTGYEGVLNAIKSSDDMLNFADSLMNVEVLAKVASERGMGVAQKYADDFINRQKSDKRIFSVQADSDLDKSLPLKRDFGNNLQKYTRFFFAAIAFVAAGVFGGGFLVRNMFKASQQEAAQRQNAENEEVLLNAGYTRDGKGGLVPPGVIQATPTHHDTTATPAKKEEVKEEVKKTDTAKVEKHEAPKEETEPKSTTFEKAFSNNKSVVSLNKKLTISPDGKQVSDGKTIKNVSDIKSIKFPTSDKDQFFEKLATALGTKNSNRLVHDFKSAFSQVSSSSRIFILDMNTKVVTTPIMEAVIKMMGGSPTSPNLPDKAIEFLKNPFNCLRTDLDLSSTQKGDQKWRNMVSNMKAAAATRSNEVV